MPESRKFPLRAEQGYSPAHNVNERWIASGIVAVVPFPCSCLTARATVTDELDGTSRLGLALVQSPQWSHQVDHFSVDICCGELRL